MSGAPVLVWFRHVLRLGDHPALQAAVATGRPVVPIFVLDDEASGPWRLGGARRWWLHESLKALDRTLRQRGSRLILRRGPSLDILREVAAEVGADSIFCTRSYEPWARRLEEDAAREFPAAGVTVKRFAGALLFEPEDIRTSGNEPFKVFTPFWRALANKAPRAPCPAPSRVPQAKKMPASDDLGSWELQPRTPDWAGGLREAWTAGEAAAADRLATFVSEGLDTYHRQRDRPDLEGTSRLSPYLAHGEISASTCWFAAESEAGRKTKGAEVFLRELAWREFSGHLLYHFPGLPEEPFRPEFAAFPWARHASALKAWQKGRTGYPLVDAGMRQLWHTGWMHNRVRMVVASFLIKHLLISWREGEAWFWDCLVDADLANNSASWQWVAGSGADAAPYFRIFNPVKQGETFDPDGAYVRRWVPELAHLPADHIQAPWTAPDDVLKAAGIMLGETYPRPIVDHSEARAAALQAFASIKGAKPDPVAQAAKPAKKRKLEAARRPHSKASAAS